ncbi:hypothetical protein ACLB0R_09770 [Sphingomonas sp. GlSt437]|uniref:hypothetical protein n=1 Tax=Sphingomonas sp. GlSt437 TaxID=3389970 RepID=UPI003A8678E2
MSNPVNAPIGDISAADVPEFVRGALEALKRAAAEARRIAIETDTGIVVVLSGKTVFISAQQLREGQV